MKLDDPGLKGVFNDPILQAARAGRGCPEPRVIAEAAEGAAGAAARERLADHMVECPDCAEEYRLALSVAVWAAKAAEPSARPSTATPAAAPRRVFGRPAAVLAVAAAVLLAAGVAFLTFRSRQDAAATERGGQAEAPATAPMDHAVLREAPEKLRWPAVQGAESYRAALYDSESTLIWRSDSTPGTEVGIPADIRAGLKPGGAYLWRFFARVGVDERASAVLEFSLSPR